MQRDQRLLVGCGAGRHTLRVFEIPNAVRVRGPLGAHSSRGHDQHDARYHLVHRMSNLFQRVRPLRRDDAGHVAVRRCGNDAGEPQDIVVRIWRVHATDSGSVDPCCGQGSGGRQQRGTAGRSKRAMQIIPPVVMSNT